MTEKEKQEAVKPKPTREQLRHQKRVNQEVAGVFDQLTKKFIDFFLDVDPESPEVEKKAKELDAKWRLYCKRKRLIPAAYVMVKDYIKAYIDEYESIHKGEPAKVEE